MSSKFLLQFPTLILVTLLAACFQDGGDQAGTRVGTETTVRARIQFPESTGSQFARIVARNRDYRPDFILRNPYDFELERTTDEDNAFSLTLSILDSALLEINSDDSAYGAWVAVARDGFLPDTIALAPPRTLRVIPTWSNLIPPSYLGFLGTEKYFPIFSQRIYDFTIPNLRFPLEIVIAPECDCTPIAGRIELNAAASNAGDTLTIGLNLDGVLRKIQENPGQCTFKLDEAGKIVTDQSQSPRCFQ